MRKLLIVLSLAGLALTVVPSLMVFTGKIDWAQHSRLMTAGMLCWFATAPFWMNRER
jgi:hypothetical protein